MKKVADVFKQILPIGTKKVTKTLRMEVFLHDVVTSHYFTKLSLQDKLLSLGRLIELFHKDYGFTPTALEDLVKSLNTKLNDEMLTLWQQSYTQYFKGQ